MSLLQNEPTEGEPNSRRVSDDPKERVLIRTKDVSRPEASLNVTGSEDGSSKEEPKGRKGWKGERRGKMGRTGLFKCKWSQLERKVLWECYARSGGRRADGYIQKVKDMWDGRDLSVRSVASLLSQLKQIEANGLLSVVERGEIERMVR